MVNKFENIKQKVFDAGQRLSELVGLEPVFKHNPGCTVRGGLTRVVEDFEVEPKIKITRTCGKCGATDSYLENKITEYPFRAGW